MREHVQIIILAIAASTAKFSGAELETDEAALLAFDEGRPQQVTLSDLEACRQTITPSKLCFIFVVS
ncbi:hypothetical protein FNW02_36830 [Komarekiella sp. 'clone 1']|uniref:Uncharacterized protein n=1 Tax=Komarekiella delphini-convector SJRDD-AB1 TaxID=2593771 RepID=A0AA41BAD2_9NOST|nr:hypothetical protein [Komarekiella delphini-convector]MBD6621129.1 hypothetical protein [Komarekiella delphini-convector SJRDD-AB1]